MFCGLFLLFFLNGSTGFTIGPFASTAEGVSTGRMTTEEMLSSLKLVATPDYPVMEGQTVHLRCSASSSPKSVDWSWQYMMKNQTWQKVGSEMDLTLSKPEQTGVYRCHARSPSGPWKESPNHTVSIIAAHLTVGENLGIAAFAFVLLLLIINLAVLSWMGWQKFADKPNNSITPAKGEVCNRLTLMGMYT
ncbi:uncharacterized protein LOC117805735 [Xyrichtys novacula]|uniref:Uncharacterized protein LOC117805735 n=1 Tax=Xyrichtys novacula TaxID=13765 RepID=A0AAV1GH72_XYRNO|nr:uncharacterized protein LOC117805735 [Xyrichtys novacula]